MRLVIGYESMYGNTHRVAEAVAEGFLADDDVTVLPVSSLSTDALAADLLVIGVPTHAHGLPRTGTRRAAVDGASTKFDKHALDQSALGTGVREWLAQLPVRMSTPVAVYDTRFRAPAWLVGHPARTIARTLAGRGARVVIPPASFFVDKSERLHPGEVERARAWGRKVRDAVTASSEVSGARAES